MALVINKHTYTCTHTNTSEVWGTEYHSACTSAYNTHIHINICIHTREYDHVTETFIAFSIILVSVHRRCGTICMKCNRSAIKSDLVLSFSRMSLGTRLVVTLGTIRLQRQAAVAKPQTPPEMQLKAVASTQVKSTKWP